MIYKFVVVSSNLFRSIFENSISLQVIDIVEDNPEIAIDFISFIHRRVFNFTPEALD